MGIGLTLGAEILAEIVRVSGTRLKYKTLDL